MRTDRYTQQSAKKTNGVVKKLLIVIVLLIAVIAAVLMYSYHSAEKSLYVNLKEPVTVEFGGEYPAMDYVVESSGEVTPESEYLDAKSTGEKELVFTSTESLFGGLMKPAKEFVLHYTVVDTEAPLVLWSGDGTVLNQGSEYEIRSLIGYGDNADPSPSLETKGEVDTDKPGDYPIHATLTDASGNVTEWDFTVTVVDSMPTIDASTEGTPFADFKEQYAGDHRSFGLDVSEWQGDIDFKSVKAAGCEFVIIRMGYSVDGEVTVDSKFDQYYKDAKEAGLKIGLYLFSYDNTEDKVRASAKWVVNKLDGDVPDLPIAFDWEDFGRFQEYDMSFADLNRLYDTFAASLKEQGYDCMLYGSKNYLEKVWKDTDTRPVWLAHYTDETDYKGPYRMWQVSNTGQIDGIKDDVDMDILLEE